MVNVSLSLTEIRDLMILNEVAKRFGSMSRGLGLDSVSKDIIKRTENLKAEILSEMTSEEKEAYTDLEKEVKDLSKKAIFKMIREIKLTESKLVEELNKLLLLMKKEIEEQKKKEELALEEKQDKVVLYQNLYKFLESYPKAKVSKLLEGKLLNNIDLSKQGHLFGSVRISPGFYNKHKKREDLIFIRQALGKPTGFFKKPASKKGEVDCEGLGFWYIGNINNFSEIIIHDDPLEALCDYENGKNKNRILAVLGKEPDNLTLFAFNRFIEECSQGNYKIES